MVVIKSTTNSHDHDLILPMGQTLQKTPRGERIHIKNNFFQGENKFRDSVDTLHEVVLRKEHASKLRAADDDRWPEYNPGEGGRLTTLRQTNLPSRTTTGTRLCPARMRAPYSRSRAFCSRSGKLN